MTPAVDYDVLRKAIEQGNVYFESRQEQRPG
jgi:hypothetical protein